MVKFIFMNSLNRKKNTAHALQIIKIKFCFAKYTKIIDPLKNTTIICTLKCNFLFYMLRFTNKFDTSKMKMILSWFWVD